MRVQERDGSAMIPSSSTIVIKIAFRNRSGYGITVLTSNDDAAYFAP